jgi:hypothetical protein
MRQSQSHLDYSRGFLFEEVLAECPKRWKQQSWGKSNQRDRMVRYYEGSNVKGAADGLRAAATSVPMCTRKQAKTKHGRLGCG